MDHGKQTLSSLRKGWVNGSSLVEMKTRTPSLLKSSLMHSLSLANGSNVKDLVVIIKNNDVDK